MGLSEAQYEYRLKKWNARKYNTKDSWKLIDQALNDRESSQKESDVWISGELVPKEKVARERKRYLGDQPTSRPQSA